MTSVVYICDFALGYPQICRRMVWGLRDFFASAHLPMRRWRE